MNLHSKGVQKLYITGNQALILKVRSRSDISLVKYFHLGNNKYFTRRVPALERTIIDPIV